MVVLNGTVQVDKIIKRMSHMKAAIGHYTGGFADFKVIKHDLPKHMTNQDPFEIVLTLPNGEEHSMGTHPTASAGKMMKQFERWSKQYKNSNLSEEAKWKIERDALNKIEILDFTWGASKNDPEGATKTFRVKETGKTFTATMVFHDVYMDYVWEVEVDGKNKYFGTVAAMAKNSVNF